MPVPSRDHRALARWIFSCVNSNNDCRINHPQTWFDGSAPEPRRVWGLEGTHRPPRWLTAQYVLTGWTGDPLMDRLDATEMMTGGTKFLGS